jgi:hypothetical protein
MPNEDQTSPVWSSFMTVADGPEPIPDPVTRKREEEMAKKREEERRWQQQQQQQQQYGQQQFQQPPQYGQQQQYPNGGMPPPPYQPHMPPYGPPFAPFPMQQPPYGNMNGGPYFPPGGPSFPASPFGGAGDGSTASGDPYQEQKDDARIQDENDRARAIVQERMAKEMAKFQEENGPSSEKSPTAWWETIQAKQNAKDQSSSKSLSNTGSEERSSTKKSPSWASTLPQPSASNTGFNNPWRPSTQTQSVESSPGGGIGATLPPPPPPPGPILGPPDMNNAWTPDSDQAPDKAPGYWSKFMAVSDGTADTPKTYEEQKAEWERQQRAMQREQEELARQQEAANDPAMIARLEADRLRVQVEQQQAEDRARWEEERLMQLEEEIQQREIEQKRAHMSVDNESPVVETEQEKAKKRLEQAETMAKKLVEQEVERAAAVARYRDLRNQIEAERQFQAEEEAREHARLQAEKERRADEDDDAIDVDAEDQEIADSISTLEALMKALEETKRKIEEEKRKAKYNGKTKAASAAEEWEAAVARARAKIMADEIIKKSEEPKNISDEIPEVDTKVSLDDDDDDDKVSTKSKVDSVKPSPTVETIPMKVLSNMDSSNLTKNSDERLTKKSEDVNTVILNGVTIVTDNSSPQYNSDVDSQDSSGQTEVVDRIVTNSERGDKGPFKFFEKAKATKNGKADSSSTDPKVDDTTTNSDSRRQYFANRIEETRKRAMIESEKRKAVKGQPPKPEPTVSPVAAEEDEERDTKIDEDAIQCEGERSNIEFFANRIAESRKRALLSRIESATSSRDSSIFVRTKIDSTRSEDTKEEKDESPEPSTSKAFAPNRLEERKKLALLATLLQELPDLIKDTDDANPDEVQKATQGLQEVILKNPFIKHNGKIPTETLKNGAEKTNSTVTIESAKASATSSTRGSKKKNGSRKVHAGSSKYDSKVSSEADFEDVKKIFEETASKLGTNNGKVKANGSSPSLIRTIGKSTSGKNETAVDSSKVEADRSSS